MPTSDEYLSDFCEYQLQHLQKIENHRDLQTVCQNLHVSDVKFIVNHERYCKLSLLLLSWLAPTTTVSVRTRGRILRIIDMLGKWSLVDAYVMVLFMVASDQASEPTAY